MFAWGVLPTKRPSTYSAPHGVELTNRRAGSRLRAGARGRASDGGAATRGVRVGGAGRAFGDTGSGSSTGSVSGSTIDGSSGTGCLASGMVSGTSGRTAVAAGLNKSATARTAAPSPITSVRRPRLLAVGSREGSTSGSGSGEGFIIKAHAWSRWARPTVLSGRPASGARDPASRKPQRRQGCVGSTISAKEQRGHFTRVSYQRAD